MANVQLILLQAQGGPAWATPVMIALMVAVFYFFMIRPQQKKAKEQEALRNGIKPGDSVQTIGGLHGKVASVESDGTVILLVDRIRMKFEKSAIQGLSTKAE